MHRPNQFPSELSIVLWAAGLLIALLLRGA
jgi:hypothetical protein